MTPTSLDHYRLLGRSGLRVSPLALGSMTFGGAADWNASAEAARQIFEAYVERGGNFIDTANSYNKGQAEILVGHLAKDQRDRLVIATKYSVTGGPGDPNAGGNHRKNMRQSVEASLRRLQCDYVDLLYLHIWDGTTAAEEILRGFEDLARAGKILHAGISDTPAWQVARMQTIAQLRSGLPIAAVQLEYSLLERTVEFDYLPMAAELGIGVCSWAPLAGGVLAAKYTDADLEQPKAALWAGSNRKEMTRNRGRLHQRGLQVAGVVTEIAGELGCTPAQVALAWQRTRAAVTAPIIGARTLPQFIDNIASLAVVLAPEHIRRLDEASAVPPSFPHALLQPDLLRTLVFGGTSVRT